mmetsp:Transcript_1037/g.1680  ORF Transcript_1037/g.1680 Transcript_1037/m.1680 type:complete len:84 (+) Transcript_1037:3-254(+)
MLIATVPDLASIVNKKAVIKKRIAENTMAITLLDNKRAALGAEHLRLTKQLASIEAEEKKDSACVGTEITCYGRKRRRSGANA